jgi:transposase InsO family protein
MCRLYGVTRAGFYAWHNRVPSARAQANVQLMQTIDQLHRDSRCTYGSPRITRALRQRGCRVSENRVARLMRHHHVKARCATLYRANPGAHAFYTSVPNRQLTCLAVQRDRVWVADVTYLKVADQWYYLAAVMDKCSRRIVGWSLSVTRDVRLTLQALDRAVAARRPRAGLIFHTDRGIEYAAYGFRARLARLGFVQSMNRPQHMNDNGHMESFFHSMKADAIHGIRFHNTEDLNTAVCDYIEFYNSQRLHSSLNYVPPATFENLLAPQGCQ